MAESLAAGKHYYLMLAADLFVHADLLVPHLWTLADRILPGSGGYSEILEEPDQISPVASGHAATEETSLVVIAIFGIVYDQNSVAAVELPGLVTFVG